MQRARRRMLLKDSLPGLFTPKGEREASPPERGNGSVNNPALLPAPCSMRKGCLVLECLRLDRFHT